MEDIYYQIMRDDVVKAVFPTQFISRRQKNVDIKVALLISRRQNWYSAIFKKLYFSKCSIKQCCK